jgi:hypothetical protein
MKPLDLQELSVTDTLDLDGDEFGLLPGGASPLSLLSPNVKTASRVGTKPAASAAVDGGARPRQVGGGVRRRVNGCTLVVIARAACRI